MKTLIQTCTLIILLLFLLPQLNAQFNDLEIGNSLIGQNKDSIEVILDRLGNNYTITKIGETNFRPVYNIYIEGKHGGVKHWIIDADQSAKIINPKTNREFIAYVIGHIRVKYIHSSSGHLKDFKAYGEPKDNEIIRYDKSMGLGQSHLELFLKEK